MILNKQDQINIFGKEGYDGSAIHSRFTYKVFRNKTLPHGNIIAIRGQMNVSENLVDLEDKLTNDFIWSDDAISFCWEIPNLCPIGAVAFQRLFNTQIAGILVKYINKPIEVDGDDIMVHTEFTGSDGSLQVLGKASVSITYSVNNVALGHTGININAGRKAPKFAYSTNLTDEQCTQFMAEVIEAYGITLDSLVLACAKIIV